MCLHKLPVSDFGKDRSRKDVLYVYCRKCHCRRIKEYYKNNPDKRIQQSKIYYRDNRERLKKQNKEYCGTIRGHLKRVFRHLRSRCDNLNDKSFNDYGGRGIRNRFKSLDEFRDYIISKLKVDPRGLQIDRINNNGHYEKGNIRFVTAKENSNNRRKRR